MNIQESKLSDHELSRVIGFLRRIRGPFDETIPGVKPDAHWNIVLELVDSHIQQQPMDVTSLIELSGATYGTGNRLITKMIADGQIVKVPRGPKHKTAFLAPSDEMRNAFVSYAMHVKAHLAKTFGLRSGSETEEYYFGGSYFASHIISPLQGHDINSEALRNLRFLLHNDNYFASMRNMWSDFRNDIGRKSSFDLVPLAELYGKAEQALTASPKTYDVVALNIPWLGRFAASGLIASLDDVLPEAAINPYDFHPSVWSTGRWNNKQYGIPIYCTIEILTARKDLFEAAQLPYPKTFDELISAARTLHKPDQQMYGVTWSAARGMTIAHDFMLFVASAQGSIIDIPRKHENWRDSFNDKDLKLRINSDEGLAAIEFMRQLREVSPPDVQTFGSEESIQCFMSGQAAMSFSWTMRAARLEHELSSKVKRRVAYLTPPVLRGRQPTAPVGGFLLTIPANVEPERKQQIVNAIAWMASPEAMKAHVRNGVPVAPRFSVCADPEAMASSPIISFVDRMARRNELNTWSRPPVPEYVEIERVLGNEIYEAVFEDKPAKKALADAETQIYRYIRENAS
ncbi:extracellular solute-binding protein [uncultured Hoeflea sp.]|uniref:extracellular solute-binding protein n=1 Tax=uncultured Hoeflea sp. TaxID=538666 RepID=UPI0030D9C15B